VTLRLLYFFYYAGVGAFLSYFAAYLRGLGFSGGQIGAISMAQQLVAAAAALAWGSVADRLGAPARVLKLCTGGALVATCALPFVHTPVAVGAVLALAAAFSGAVVPLVDSVAVGRLGMRYARTRLFGSLGYIVVAQALGLLLAARGDRAGDGTMPLVFVGCVLLYAAVAQTLPGGPPAALRNGALPAPAAPQDPARRPHWREAAALLGNAPLLVLLAVCAVHWAACAPYHLMFGVLVRDRGLSSSYTGLGFAIGVVGEVFALLAFPALERRFSLRALLAAASAGTVVRWLLLGRASSAAELVGLQALHALTFGIWWGCAVEAMARTVPGRLRATGQALFSAVVFGAGNALGYGLAGLGYDRLGGAAQLFTLAAAVEVIPLLLVIVLARPLSLQPVRA
jgi:PPP family 3-phenylpropionic acid transporter